MNDPNDHDAMRDQMIDHVLGLLGDEEARALEAHVERDGADADELRRYQDVLRDVALSAPPRTPPMQLKERLMRTIRAPRDEVQIWRRWRRDTNGVQADRELIRADEGEFESTGIEGVYARRLAADQAAGRVTMMVRMDPGARYPAHRHGGAEECYVLSGDLHHGEQVMGAGDFELAEEGSLHGEQWTEEGCLLLIHSSVHDELVPS